MVFVTSEDGIIKVLTIVDDNRLDLRNRIYAREAAIIDEYPRIEFDFHILPRMGHDLADVVDFSREIAYRR